MASKRLQAYAASQDEEMSVDMSPMIDLVFLLLIFFLVNANMIVVKMDKDVEVPVAKDSQKQEDKNGRIVVNVYSDGTVKDANGKMTFDSDTDLINFLQEQKLIVEGFGYKPSLHLRGDRKAVFRHARRVINCASKAGFSDVKFATYQVKQKGY